MTNDFPLQETQEPGHGYLEGLVLLLPSSTAPTVDPTPLMYGVLAAQLRGKSWRPGAPERISARTQVIDAQLCQELICPNPAYRQELLEYRPGHKGNGYTILARCPACGAGEGV